VKKLLFIINPALSEPLAEGVELFRQSCGNILEIRALAVSDIEEELISSEAAVRSLRQADMVFLDIRGGGKALALCTRILSETEQPVALLLGGSPDLMSLLRLGSFSLKKMIGKRSETNPGTPPAEPDMIKIQRMMQLVETGGSLLPVGKLRHARNWTRIMRYWRHGGPENIKNLILFAAQEYLDLSGQPKAAGPVEYPDYGLYDPLSGRSYQQIEDYRQAEGFQPDQPTVGLLFYGGMHFSQSVVPARAYAQALKGLGLNILPLFSTSGYNLKAVESFFLNKGTVQVDAVVYFQWFQLTAFTPVNPKASIDLLKQLNVPVFSACPMYGREIHKWQESVQGLSPVEALTTVILPELDGMIEPLPTAGLVEKNKEVLGGIVKEVQAIEDRVERSCCRIHNWLRLQRKPNGEKRVAFLVYDNPPGEDNIGNAAYLDTFSSLKKLFQEMAARGYQVNSLPEEGLHEYLLQCRLVNKARWGGEDIALHEGFSLSAKEYSSLLAGILPRAEVTTEWGPEPGEIMVHRGRVLLPAVNFGNIILGLQPARGVHSDPDKISHDQTLPPHHQYVALYRWLEEVWQPDCVVHVGTHGTLEFLKGKEMGMSSSCFPEALIGNCPHLYFYHVVNASEATIAKRRSLGVLINYNSPAFAASGLYDGYESLDQLISECLEAKALEPQRAERLEQRIMEQAAELRLTANSLAGVQEEIALMKRSIIPKGLHVLGEGVKEASCLDFATFFLRYDRGEVPSLHRLLAEAQGMNYEALLCPSTAATSFPPCALEDIEAEVAALVRRAWFDGHYPDNETASTALRQALAAARNLDGTLEFDNFFAGLEGCYIEPALGGDPLRNPEVLPTGRNSYQFDPRLTPSEEACRRGMQIAENTLKQYYDLHGTWPDSSAVILWGFETTKTKGETVGQILGYLGVRVIQNSNPFHKKLEVIPLADLGRPRIDCLVQICGFFRDMYPNVMDMINRAFLLVSELPEADEENHVRRNTLALKKKLADEVPTEHLASIAAGRIFGPRAGEYGTRTTNLIETGAWTSEEEISDLFTSTMSHLYTEKIHGERQLAAYRSRLCRVEAVSQIRDSHEYEIMDLDHYYEFFGGLSRTVEAIRGQAPVMLISDTSKEVIRTETVKESLNRGIRTRLLNPKWIDALLEHDYHGGQKIGDRVENLIGFAATTHAVDNWVWSAVTERYVADAEMFRRLRVNNRFAAEEIIKRLLEAEQRGYWQAAQEELDLLRDRYLELEGEIEEQMEP
jgi:cobaltochelatase CobN